MKTQAELEASQTALIETKLKYMLYLERSNMKLADEESKELNYLLSTEEINEILNCNPVINSIQSAMERIGQLERAIKAL